MLFKEINFNDPLIKNALQLDIKRHQSTWSHYYDSYNYAVSIIFDMGLKESYAFNPRAYGLLFLIRHSFELSLKYNLEINNLPIPQSHVFDALLKELEEKNLISIRLREILNQINYHNDDKCDGTCYRYYINKNTGKSFFNTEQIKLITLIKDFNNFSSSKFSKNDLCAPFDYNDKSINWALTLHMGECRGLGTLKTQYDSTIEFLIDGIIHKSYDINRLYLPLFFLIRHSLELALKHNLYEAEKNSSTVFLKKKLNQIHSLSQLYNLFGGEKGYLSKLKIEELPIETKQEYDFYKDEYEKLNNQIHFLDKNSQFFRYPDPLGKGSSSNPLRLNDKNELYNVLKLYYLTDPFITFTNAVLIDAGLLDFDLSI